MMVSRSSPVSFVAAALVAAALLDGCAAKQPPDPQIEILQRAEQERIAAEKVRRAAEEEQARAENTRRAADRLLQETAAAEEKARQDKEKARRAEKLQLIIK
ncbi:MAG: hypothetical protein HQL66_15415 [Magnetococcales bacterium]|nr:hypothetical protein [Magnetococcales bacterium]